MFFMEMRVAPTVRRVRAVLPIRKIPPRMSKILALVQWCYLANRWSMDLPVFRGCPLNFYQRGLPNWNLRKDQQLERIFYIGRGDRPQRFNTF
jgi:hypothetical protein